MVLLTGLALTLLRLQMKVGDLVKPRGEFFEWRSHFGIIVEDAGHTMGRDPSFRTYRVQWFDEDHAHKVDWWDDFQLEVVHETKV